MSIKRKDKKGRVLRSGECQRNDGMYQYDYTDPLGKQKCVYSWKLEETDPIPQGKRKCKSLREKEREILKSLHNNVVPYADNFTVLNLVKKYVLQKAGVRPSTKSGYKTVINILANDSFGALPIYKIKMSDAKIWLITLQQKEGRGYSSIHTIRGVLRPAFQMAVDDDLIRKNPFDFPLTSVVINDSVTRDAITLAQKKKFLEFIRNDPHFSRYYDGIYILFYTGMRISEFTGLTLGDVDIKNKRVSIERQLQRTNNMQYVILPPKTKAGLRVIPITNDVCDCFRRIINSRKTVKVEPAVDGISGFLFLDKNNMPMTALHWEKYFQRIVEKYNKIYKQEMPKITPHVCRHTYCSHMASSGMNPKHLQYLMGHSDISVTLNTYAHVDLANIVNEIKQFEHILE